jgi:hypothetical protein
MTKQEPKGGKTRAIRRQKLLIRWQNSLIRWQNLLIRRQNSCHKAANLRKKLHCLLKIFFPAHQKICTAHQKSICAAEIAISTFYHTLVILLSFWHTFKYFCILSQLLAHCADQKNNSAAVMKLV